MDQTTLQAQAEQGNVSQEEPKASPSDSGTPAPVVTAQDTQSPEEYLPILVPLQSTQKYLSAAPTFIPQTFQEQIQFVSMGGANYLYFYANNQWNQLGTVGKFDYGDGSDGAVVMDNSNTFGFATLSSGTYTLKRDIFCTTFTLNASVTLKPNGFKILASTSIDILGTISLQGGDASNASDGGSTVSGGGGSAAAGGAGGAGGTGIPSGTLKEPGNGVAGTKGEDGGHASFPNQANGVAGANETNCCQGNNGANGGGGGMGNLDPGTGITDNSSTGGAGGTATQTTKLKNRELASNPSNAIGPVGCNPGSGSGAGGGGGISSSGAGGLGGGGGGGGAGAPGGFGWLASPIITIHIGSTLTLNGGKGGNGGFGGSVTGPSDNRGGGGGGGGAGGNGGFCLLITPSYTNSGTATAAGGTGGSAGNGQTGGANGTAGSNGNTGAIVQLTP